MHRVDSVADSRHSGTNRRRAACCAAVRTRNQSAGAETGGGDAENGRGAACCAPTLTTHSVPDAGHTRVDAFAGERECAWPDNRTTHWTVLTP